MTVVNGYCTVTDLREQLGDSTEKLSEILLERAINATSRAVDKYTSRRFWADSVATTRVYKAIDPVRIWTHDISTTAGLVVKTDTNFDGSYATTWATTDYQLEPLNAGVAGGTDIPTPYAWWRIVAVGSLIFPMDLHRATVSVTAKFGWSAVPDDVQEAVLIKAVSLFRRKDAPFGIVGATDFGAVRIGRNDPDVTDLLSPYVIPGF